MSTVEPNNLLFLGECESELPGAELYNYTGKITIC